VGAKNKFWGTAVPRSPVATYLAVMCTAGAQDFLPDFESASSCVSIVSIYPRYRPISSAMQKAKKWIADARVRLFVEYRLVIRLWN